MKLMLAEGVNWKGLLLEDEKLPVAGGTPPSMATGW